jgi:hypothetical protein
MHCRAHMGTKHIISSRGYRNADFLKFYHLEDEIVCFVTYKTKFWFSPILFPRNQNILGAKIGYFGIFWVLRTTFGMRSTWELDSNFLMGNACL